MAARSPGTDRRRTANRRRHLITVQIHPLPAWQTWLYQRLRGSLPDWEYCTLRVFDALAGNLCGSVESGSPIQLIDLSADGRTLAVSALGTISIWDIPPRKPGGIVLGLMMVEVVLAIVWTAWRRRRRKWLRLLSP
jgi:hypothetical protein